MRLNGYRIKEAIGYNQRLAPESITLTRCTDNQWACVSAQGVLTLGYTYVANATGGNLGGPDNNGNVRRQQITVPGTGGFVAQQGYEYDKWNRVKKYTEQYLGTPDMGTPVETAKVEDYCYDKHGNRAMLFANGMPDWVPKVLSCDAASVKAIFPGNRWNSGHDAGGGLATDSRLFFRYDAENRLARSWPVGTTSLTTVYGYDGDGRRVSMRTGTSSPVVFVYDASGQLAAEYGGSGTTGTQYLHVDHLGSTRVVTDAAGGVARRMDYTPFGVELTLADKAVTGYRTAALGYTPDWLTRLKFTGKERDFETGLDYFGARYMWSAQGRFTSPDAPFADQFAENPQSWNLYSYTRNNPLRFIDDDGRGAKEFFFGMTNAVSSNAGATQRVRSSHPDVRLGQRLGDGLSIVGGFIEMAGGTAMTGTGAGACGTGVLCVAGAPAMAVGVTAAGHGAMMAGNGSASFMSGSDDAPQSSGSDETLTRYGDKPETVERLAEQAAKAEAHPKVGIHGVSTTTQPKPNLPGGQASRSAVEGQFKVHNTLGKGHRTVELPKPVTQQIADAFNKLFGFN
ncbi:MAG: RHS repeat-associated core domain-containing protein, partial [Bryobacterales bacterium]|nr:RHS repeat-associated core domain-containing protein [Bryobacterales bacterium]